MRTESRSIRMNQCCLILLLLTTVYCEEICRRGMSGALIPARSGSKGVKRKNLSRVGNETLLGRALNAIHKSGAFDSVWVSTDGEEIADEAVGHGAEVHWRDGGTATDEAGTVSAVVDFLRFHRDIETLTVVQCTSPFLQPEFLVEATRKMKDCNLDCVFSVSRVYNLRWYENKDGYVTPLNFDPNSRPRRQDWDGELIENGMFYMFRTRLVLEEGVLQNNRCGVVEIPKKYSLEIDSEDDLLIARQIEPFLL